MIIGVDLDGTLTKEVEGHNYSARTPNMKMIQWVNKKFKEGHVILLWSSRWESDRKVTKDWLTKYKVKHHSLVLNKLKLDLLVDDISKRPEEVV